MSSVTVATGICVAKADPMRQRIEGHFSGKIEGVKKRPARIATQSAAGGPRVAASSSLR